MHLRLDESMISLSKYQFVKVEQLSLLTFHRILHWYKKGTVLCNGEYQSEESKIPAFE